jgi:hypothetical protein
MSDSYNEFESFKTKKELLDFYYKYNYDFNNENTKLRLAIFDNKIYNKSVDRFNIVKDNSDFLVLNNIKENKSVDNLFFLIENLQNDHLVKYKNLNNKSFFLLDNIKMKEE